MESRKEPEGVPVSMSLRIETAAKLSSHRQGPGEDRCSGDSLKAGTGCQELLLKAAMLPP